MTLVSELHSSAQIATSDEDSPTIDDRAPATGQASITPEAFAAERARADRAEARAHRAEDELDRIGWRATDALIRLDQREDDMTCMLTLAGKVVHEASKAHKKLLRLKQERDGLIQYFRSVNAELRTRRG